MVKTKTMVQGGILSTTTMPILNFHSKEATTTATTTMPTEATTTTMAITTMPTKTTTSATTMQEEDRQEIDPEDQLVGVMDNNKVPIQHLKIKPEVQPTVETK